MADAKRWIMLLDDNEPLRRTLVARLKKEHFEVVHAGTITDATAMISNQKFDCILLDVHIRDTTTEKLLRTTRENRQNLNQRTPVIMLSGAMDAEFVKRVRSIIGGALVKPFEFSALLALIKSVSGMGPPAATRGKAAKAVGAPQLEKGDRRKFEDYLAEAHFLLDTAVQSMKSGEPVTDGARADLERTLDLIAKMGKSLGLSK